MGFGGLQADSTNPGAQIRHDTKCLYLYDAELVDAVSVIKVMSSKRHYLQTIMEFRLSLPTKRSVSQTASTAS